MNLHKLEAEINTRRENLIKKKGQNELIYKEIEKANILIDKLGKSLKTCKTGLDFLEAIANGRRGNMKKKIESILTEGVKMIYGENYSVEFTYGVKNNRSHLDIQVVKNTSRGKIIRTMEGFGGGLSDSLSVPLRLLILLGSKQTEKICILDEPFKGVDQERITNVAKFIKGISEKLGIQLILLSHHEIMQDVADKVFYVNDNDGTSEIS